MRHSETEHEHPVCPVVTIWLVFIE